MATKKSSKAKKSQGGETYKRICKLGKGAFGTAYLVECQSDKSKVVIKQIKIDDMDEDKRR